MLFFSTHTRTQIRDLNLKQAQNKYKNKAKTHNLTLTAQSHSFTHTCSGARPGGGGGGLIDGETRVTWQVQAEILKSQYIFQKNLEEDLSTGRLAWRGRHRRNFVKVFVFFTVCLVCIHGSTYEISIVLSGLFPFWRKFLQLSRVLEWLPRTCSPHFKNIMAFKG